MTTKVHILSGIELARPFQIRRLGHFGVNVESPEHSLHFYRDLLGFKVSDQIDFADRLPPELKNQVGPTVGFFTRHGTDHHSFVLFPKKAVEKVNPQYARFPQLTANQLINALNHDENEMIWIWMGQNAHDVSGYYWLMSQFKEYQSRIHVLYLNNLPFLNEKGQLFYPTHLSQIQPKEFLKAKKLARPITLSEFELDPDEWKKLCQENEGVRFLEGGKKLVSMHIGCYDKEILSLLTKNAQKLPSALSNIMAKLKVKLGDAFIVARLKALEEAGKIVFVGSWTKGWKDMVVQMPGGSSIVNETEA